MVKQVKRLEDVAAKSDGYVFCYVSLDGREVDAILGENGFSERGAPKENRLDQTYQKPLKGAYVCMHHNKTRALVEILDLGLEYMQEVSPELGFDPQSLLKIHENGGGKLERAIVDVNRAMWMNRINRAFLTSSRTKGFIAYGQDYEPKEPAEFIKEDWSPRP